MRIAVDFDGTIVEDRHPSIGAKYYLIHYIIFVKEDELLGISQ